MFSFNPIILVIVFILSSLSSLVIFIPLYFVFRFLAEKITKSNIWSRMVVYGLMTVVANIYSSNMDIPEDILLEKYVTVILIITFLFFLFLDYLYKKIIVYYNKRRLNKINIKI